MGRPGIRLFLVVALTLCLAMLALAEERSPRQFILFNRTAGPASHRFEPVARENFTEIKRAFPDVPGAEIRVGVGYIFSYFRTRNDEVLLASLRRVLELAEETDTPVLIQIDGENFRSCQPRERGMVRLEPGAGPEGRVAQLGQAVASSAAAQLDEPALS